MGPAQYISPFVHVASRVAARSHIDCHTLRLIINGSKLIIPIACRVCQQAGDMCESCRLSGHLPRLSLHWRRPGLLEKQLQHAHPACRVPSLTKPIVSFCQGRTAQDMLARSAYLLCNRQGSAACIKPSFSCCAAAHLMPQLAGILGMGTL